MYIADDSGENDQKLKTMFDHINKRGYKFQMKVSADKPKIEHFMKKKEK